MPVQKKTRNITPEDLKKVIGVGDPHISPDGNKILFTRSHVGEKNKTIRHLWLADAETGKATQFTSGGKDGHGRWSPNGRSIAFISGREEGPSQIFLIPRDGGEANAVSRLPEGTIGGFQWAPDNRTLAFLFRHTNPEQTKSAGKKREEEGLSTPPMVIERMFYRVDGDGYFNAQRFHLYLLDTTTGKHRILFDQAPEGVGILSWAPDGKDLLIVANLAPEPFLEPWQDRLYRVNVKTGQANLLPNQKDGYISLATWSPDGERIAFSGLSGRRAEWGSRNEQLFVYHLKKSLVTCLSGKEDYCLGATVLGDMAEAGFGSSFIWTPDSRHLLLSFGWHGNRHLARIKATGGTFEFLTSGDGQYSISNISADGRALPVIHGHALTPGNLCLAHLEEGRAVCTQLTRFNQKLLSGLKLSVPDSGWVKAGDGHPVHFWIMKPPGFQKGKKYPAVLQIHGGPHALYGNTFFHEFQVLAANGYVVFFSNPRGSKGYGEQHCHAIAGNWGNKDWIDIQAMTALMKKQPFVDQRRMGVMGGSYGGYMTNWVIGHTNDFAGAITDRCVSNLVSMNGSSDFTTLPDSYWRGNSWDDIKARWDQSPIKYFGQVKTPTLIIHSEGDLRCNIEQADQIFTLLKVRKVPCRYVRYPRETSHGMSRCGPPDLRIHRLHQILDWWNRYLKKA